jgi:hypothetical protein
VKLASVVQHHPSRAHLLPALVAQLPGAVSVAEDPDPTGRPSAWRTYQLALRSAPEDATHLLVIQDDAVPQPLFKSKLRTAVRENPGSLIALFVAGRPVIFEKTMTSAKRDGERYANLHGCPWVPVVATVWPVELIEPFLEYAKQHTRPDFRGDDSIVGKWAKTHEIRRVATVPCLVQHPDCEPSLVGRKAGYGRNRARVAAML